MIVTYTQIVAFQPVVAIAFGILILMIPRLLNSLVGAYLILSGIVGLWPALIR